MAPRTAHALAGLGRAGDKLYFGGLDYAAGIVRILDVPSVALIYLHEQLTGRLVARTWSNAAGEFRFDNIDPAAKFYAVAFDPVSGEKADVFDRI